MPFIEFRHANGMVDGLNTDHIIRYETLQGGFMIIMTDETKVCPDCTMDQWRELLRLAGQAVVRRQHGGGTELLYPVTHELPEHPGPIDWQDADGVTVGLTAPVARGIVLRNPGLCGQAIT